MATRTFTTHGGPVDIARTLFPLRRGTSDPTMQVTDREVWWTTRTPGGPATLHLIATGETIEAQAWGPGADDVLEAAPGLIGATDTAAGFVPHDDVVANLWRRHRGIRLTRTGSLMRVLLPAILEQKVTGLEARRAWRGTVRAVAEPGPGPRGDLLLPPDPARLAALPYFSFHRFGVPRRRAELIRGICDRAARIESLAALPPVETRERLQRLPGIGPWTAAEVTRLGMADPDAVSVGDYHLPNLVTWMLAGEPRGTDERMLELLEPYRGHRGRVQRLLEAAGRTAPKFGPRTDVHSIAGI